MRLAIGTRTGFSLVVQDGDGWRPIGRALEGHFVTTVSAGDGRVLAGTTDGIYLSTDQGTTWQEATHGLSIRHVRWLTTHPTSANLIAAGTEPAAIFLSGDGGSTWRECPEVTALREEYGWWLPYSPESGCVRGFAFHGKRAYAAVEVGGMLRSDDGGITWRLADGSDGQPKFGRPNAGRVHPDVHSVTIHPSSADWVLAPTGGGFYASSDGGATWDCLYDNCYVRAVWVDPHDTNHMILGPSAGSSGRDGRIEVTEDGGNTWAPMTQRWQRNMVDRFVEVGDSLFAIMANGELLFMSLAHRDWDQVLGDVQGINDLDVLPS